MMAAILGLLSLAAEIFSKSGGPELLHKWLLDKKTELEALRDSLKPPPDPHP